MSGLTHLEARDAALSIREDLAAAIEPAPDAAVGKPVLVRTTDNRWHAQVTVTVELGEVRCDA